MMDGYFRIPLHVGHHLVRSPDRYQTGAQGICAVPQGIAQGRLCSDAVFRLHPPLRQRGECQRPYPTRGAHAPTRWRGSHHSHHRQAVRANADILGQKTPETRTNTDPTRTFLAEADQLNCLFRLVLEGKESIQSRSVTNPQRSVSFGPLFQPINLIAHAEKKPTNGKGSSLDGRTGTPTIEIPFRGVKIPTVIAGTEEDERYWMNWPLPPAFKLLRFSWHF